LASLQHVTAILSAFPRLAAGTIFVIFGRAHQLVLPHPANPDQGTQWIPKLSGGGTRQLVLSRADQLPSVSASATRSTPNKGRSMLLTPNPGSSLTTIPRPFSPATTSCP
jgi:hypothetical protein